MRDVRVFRAGMPSLPGGSIADSKAAVRWAGVLWMLSLPGFIVTLPLHRRETDGKAYVHKRKVTGATSFTAFPEADINLPM